MATQLKWVSLTSFVYHTGRFWPDELIEPADCIYTYYQVVRDQAKLDFKRLKEKTRNKILVIFTELVRYDPEVFDVFREYCSILNELQPQMLILMLHTNIYVYGLLSYYLTVNWQYFDFFPSIPYTWTIPIPTKRKPAFIAWAYNEYKGRTELEKAKADLPDGALTIFDYNHTPLSWAIAQAQTLGLMWAARHEGVGRTIVQAGITAQCALLLNTRAPALECYTFYRRDNYGFTESVVICESYDEWVSKAKWFIQNPAAMEEQGRKFHQWFKKYEEYWNWHIGYDRWVDQFGFVLPKDMTPFHHLPENYFTPEMFDSPLFPKGKWSENELSLNFSLGR